MEIIPFNGRFTIESPRGGHKTFQIKTGKRGDFKGKRVLSIFFGRENTNDRQYRGFAFVFPERVAMWRRFQGDATHAMYITMLISLVKYGEESQFAKRGYKLLMEKRCRACNKPLTNPISIAEGIGPECSGRNRRRQTPETVAANEFDAEANDVAEMGWDAHK